MVLKKGTDTLLKAEISERVNETRRPPKPVVLIVEDEETLAQLLALRLKRKHYLTLIAHDGNKACQMAIKTLPDVILLDIMLPKKDGWEVCRFIRSHNDPRISIIPIIMISALNTEDLENKAISIGADRFLRKPYNFGEIFHTIDLVL